MKATILFDTFDKETAQRVLRLLHRTTPATDKTYTEFGKSAYASDKAGVNSLIGKVVEVKITLTVSQ